MQTTRSAGGVIVNPRGQIALVQNGAGGQWWGFPKGHIDPGEDEITAARREIEEETGLTDLEFVEKLSTYRRYKGTPDGGDDTSELKIIQMYLFTTAQEHLAPRDPQNPEARWVSASDVERMLAHPKDREFFRSIAGRLS